MTEPTFSTTSTGDRIRDRFTVLAQPSLYRRFTDVLLCMTDYSDRIVAVVPPFTIERRDPKDFEAIVLTPTIDGPAGLEFLQSALDAAWAAGLRPKNWRDERPGEIKAMDAHLQDMRRLVFGETLPNPIAAFNSLTRKDHADVG
jgi:hypothetical protein